MERSIEQIQKVDTISNEIVNDLLRAHGNVTAYLEFVRLELDRHKQLMDGIADLSRILADGMFEPIVDRKKYAQAFEYGSLLGLHIAQKELTPFQFQAMGTAVAVANKEIDEAAQQSMVDLPVMPTGNQVWEYWQYFFNHTVLEEGINNYENAPEEYQFLVNDFGDFFTDPDDLRLGMLFYGGFGYMHGIAGDLSSAYTPRHAA